MPTDRPTRQGRDVESRASSQKEFHAHIYEGPLPPPEQMAKYEQMMPGATEQFFRMFESQTQHRQVLERLVIENNIRSTNRGQWMAFVLLLTIGVLGFVAMMSGFRGAGFLSAFAGVASVLVLFFGRRRQYDRELRHKDSMGR